MTRRTPQFSGERTEDMRRLGREAAKMLEPLTEFGDIGKSMGISKQSAQNECFIALGKLIYRTRKSLGNDWRESSTNTIL